MTSWVPSPRSAGLLLPLGSGSDDSVFSGLGSFFGGLIASGTVQTVLSYVPVTSGVAMPMRLLQGNAATWEPLVSLALTLAFAAAAIGVSERLYRRSVLQSGGRVSVKQALRAED